MIPIRDDAPRFSTPYITYFLLAMNVATFLYATLLGPAGQEAMVTQFGLEPLRVHAYLHLGGVTGWLGAFLPFVTSMFLHAGWLHLIANMWVLWIFGDNVEDYLGHFPYLIFYLLAGIAGGLLHVAFNGGSAVPTVGASGAIAGVMGAFFLLYPRAKVLTIVPLIVIFTFWWLPAWIVLGYWFVAQFFFGAASSFAEAHGAGGGVAFWAHVGGFLAGLGMIKLFPRRVHRYRYGAW